jgi:hypothetical protein
MDRPPPDGDDPGAEDRPAVADNASLNAEAFEGIAGLELGR